MSPYTHLYSPRPASMSDNGISGESQPYSSAASGQQPRQTLKCPRCNSPNTKFCYYNNYSLSQPRHFCKTCLRYWTRGGSLRNVPVGGSGRKNKRASAVKHSAACSPPPPLLMEDSSKFFHGLVSTAVDFQLSGLPLDKIANINPNETSNLHQLSSPSSYLFGNQASIVEVGSVLSLTGIGNCPVDNYNGAPGIVGVDSSAETLEGKLQQQRMGMLFVPKETTDSSDAVSNGVVERPQPILFRNLDMNSARREDSTEWCFGNSAAHASHDNNQVSSSITSGWNGVQAWTDLNQYSVLP